MFELGNKGVIKACLPVLETLFREHKETYINLFFLEKDLDFDRLDLTPLLETGIVKRVENKFRANVLIFPLSGKFIVCDFLISLHRVRDGRYLRRKDDVWPIFAYESPYIAKKAIVKKGDSVLDLATGSGIIALFCADKARKVIGTDINPKAINYAQFNAILNGLDDKVEFRVGDLFEPVSAEKFDLIIWNGPTVATPDLPDKYPMYCFGGEDGLDFTRKFIEKVPNYLSPKGRMQWLDPCLGNENSPKSLEIIKEIWKNNNFSVVYEQRVRPNPLFNLYKTVDQRLLKPKKGLPRPLWIEPLTGGELSGWLEFLKKNNFTHIHAGMYRVYPSKSFKITKTQPKKVLFPRMNYLPQDWHFLSSSSTKRLLRTCDEY